MSRCEPAFGAKVTRSSASAATRGFIAPSTRRRTGVISQRRLFRRRGSDAIVAKSSQRGSGRSGAGEGRSRERTRSPLLAGRRALATATSIPFLGAGANLCDRPATSAVGAGQLPRRAARELARRPRRAEPLPERGRPRPAARLAVRRRRARRGPALRVPPRGLRRRLPADVAAPAARARCRRCCASAACRSCSSLTTNYDDLIERALADEGLECDVVWYEAKHGAAARGRFVHRAPGEEVGADRRGRTSTRACRSRSSARWSSSCTAASTATTRRDDSYVDHRGQLHRLPLRPATSARRSRSRCGSG